MPVSVQDAIRAMLQIIDAPKRDPSHPDHPPVVCISRDCGAGGDDLAQALAARLGVPVYDTVLLDKIAERAHADPQVVKALDEGAHKARDMWLYSLVTGQDFSRGTYKRHLVNVVLSLGRTGGVFVGRGAHIILGGGGALRLRVTGSEAACAARLAAAEGIGEDEARRKVARVNDERGQFIWETFQERLNDPRHFDLTINTDFLDLSRLAELAFQAYEAMRARAA